MRKPTEEIVREDLAAVIKHARRGIAAINERDWLNAKRAVLDIGIEIVGHVQNCQNEADRLKREANRG